MFPARNFAQPAQTGENPVAASRREGLRPEREFFPKDRFAIIVPHKRQKNPSPKKMESKLDISPWAWYSIDGKDAFHFIQREGDPLKNRLEEYRKARGIRQEELAEILQVSRQTIGSLENGRYNPSILLAFKIARYFETTIEDIFIYEEEDPK